MGDIFRRRMRERLQALRIENITDEEGNILMMADINARWRVHINWAEYFRLREELARIKEKFGNNADVRDGRELNDFIQSKKTGCKRYRMIFVGRRTKWYAERDPKLIASAGTLWGQDLDSMSRILVEPNLVLGAL